MYHPNPSELPHHDRRRQLSLLSNSLFAPTLFIFPETAPATAPATTTSPAQSYPLTTPDLTPFALRSSQERFNKRQSTATHEANKKLMLLRKAMRESVGFKDFFDRAALLETVCESVGEIDAGLDEEIFNAFEELAEGGRRGQVEYLLARVSGRDDEEDGEGEGEGVKMNGKEGRGKRTGLMVKYDHEVEEEIELARKEAEAIERDKEERSEQENRMEID